MKVSHLYGVFCQADCQAMFKEVGKLIKQNKKQKTWSQKICSFCWVEGVDTE